MMSGKILEEFQNVGVAFLSGALITFVYDLFRIFRRVISHGNFWIGVEDFFFWSWTSLWTFSVLYRENDGHLRMYTIFTMVVGMVVYHKLVSELFVRMTERILKKILMILGYPVKKIKIIIIFCRKKLKKLWKQIIMKENR